MPAALPLKKRGERRTSRQKFLAKATGRSVARRSGPTHRKSRRQLPDKFY